MKISRIIDATKVLQTNHFSSLEVVLMVLGLQVTLFLDHQKMWMQEYILLEFITLCGRYFVGQTPEMS